MVMDSGYADFVDLVDLGAWVLMVGWPLALGPALRG